MKKTQSRAEFIRSLPLDMPTEKAIEKAVAAGFKGTTKRHIWAVRTLMKRKAGIPAYSKGKGPSATAKSTRPPRHGDDFKIESRRALLQAVLHLGLDGVQDELLRIQNDLMRIAADQNKRWV